MRLFTFYLGKAWIHLPFNRHANSRKKKKKIGMIFFFLIELPSSQGLPRLSSRSVSHGSNRPYFATLAYILLVGEKNWIQDCLLNYPIKTKELSLPYYFFRSWTPAFLKEINAKWMPSLLEFNSSCPICLSILFIVDRKDSCISQGH